MPDTCASDGNIAGFRYVEAGNHLAKHDCVTMVGLEACSIFDVQCYAVEGLSSIRPYA
jgi:hypothetical protein